VQSLYSRSDERHLSALDAARACPLQREPERGRTTRNGGTARCWRIALLEEKRPTHTAWLRGGRGFVSRSGSGFVKTLVAPLHSVTVTEQYNFVTGQRAPTLCGWEGNRMSGIALATSCTDCSGTYGLKVREREMRIQLSCSSWLRGQAV